MTTSDALLDIISSTTHCVMATTTSITDVFWMSIDPRILDFAGAYMASIYRGTIAFMDVEEPYIHDRVVHQFGRQQSRPLDVIDPSSASRPIQFVGNTLYKLTFARAWDGWEQLNENLCPFILESLMSVPAWDVDDEYLDWYLQISHLYVSPLAQVQPRIMRGPPPVVDVHRRLAMATTFAQKFIQTRGGGPEWDHMMAVLCGDELPIAEPLIRASQLSFQSIGPAAESSATAEYRAQMGCIPSIYERGKSFRAATERARTEDESSDDSM